MDTPSAGRKPSTPGRGNAISVLVALAMALAPASNAPARAAEAPRATATTPVPRLDGRPLTLQDCVAIARASNLTLKVARASYGRAQASHYGSTGRFLPVLSGGASHEQHPDLTGIDFRKDVYSAGLDQLLPLGTTVSVSQDLHRAPTPIHTGTLTTGVTQPLLRGAGWLATVGPVTSARWAMESSERSLATTDRSIVLSTTLAYLDAVRNRALIDVVGGALQADSLLVDASESLVAARMATRRDVLSAQLRVADDRASLVGAYRNYALSLDGLKEQLGVPMETPIALAQMQLPDTTLELDEEGLVRDALAGHPALQSAVATVRRDEVEWKLARNARLPRLDVTGSYSETFTSDPSAARDRVWLAALQVGLPVINRQADAAADIARYSLDQDRDRLELLRIQTQRSVREALSTLRGIQEELKAIRQTIILAQEKLEYATAMFNLGRASNKDLTDARESLVKGRSDYVSKLTDYHGQLAVLKGLTGRELLP